ncbi:MAG: AcrR family transcriptional regulator [Paraglaciecola psychrophila]|jgi:AcrR family transcriptional regulator
MTDRKDQILKTAIEMIAEQGYAGLSMRALARAAGMKLGALQYHFRTSDDMLRAVVGYIAKAYDSSFNALRQHDSPLSVLQIVNFILDDQAGNELLADRLWPQLWAMQQVEPLVSDLVEEIYTQYLQVFEQALQASGSSAPRAEALCLMSMLEGSTLLMGGGRKWENETATVRKTIVSFINSRYGEKL